MGDRSSYDILSPEALLISTGPKLADVPLAQWVASLPRWPDRLDPLGFYPAAYRLMYLSRQLEERLLELFKKGYCKGTVTISSGNEGTTIGMGLPFRPGRDVLSLLHRDFGAHLAQGLSLHAIICQYMANAESPTHGREGNVHHGAAAQRRFPMISHLGNMLSLVVGGAWAARQNGERVFGLAVIGDGGTSTGDFHESLNIASVHRVPVLFLVENNGYSFSTPTSAQYHCRQLSDRAAGYGICGRTIDGTDVFAVYSAVCDALDAMQADPQPVLLECMSIRMHGHAAYDKAEYVTAQEREDYRRRDPLPRARDRLREVCDLPDSDVAALERTVDDAIQEAVLSALAVARPDHAAERWSAYAVRSTPRVKPYQARKLKNGEAVLHALDYLLAQHPRAVLLGQDVGAYGSAFKTCKGLVQRYGPERVIDMPIAESATVGFALGAAQVGAQPMVEFQFADFSTEACTQLGLNAGTWHYRTGQPAPLLIRLPCGGGLGMGAFHSGEFEGLWSRFGGLKILYPSTAQETFEALVAGFYDPNPCLVLEHKLLYWSKSGDVDFDGDLESVWRARRYTEGDAATVVALGAMVYEALRAASQLDRPVEVWNPLALQPLDLEPILRSVEKTGRLLVVQECPESQGLADRIVSCIVRERLSALRCRPRVIAAPETPVPFATELEAYYRPNADRIRDCLESMFGES